MANKAIPFKIKPFVEGQSIADAEDVEIDESGFSGLLDGSDANMQAIAERVDSQGASTTTTNNLQREIDGLSGGTNTGSVASAAFETFNSNITIDASNIELYRDKILLYNPILDQDAELILPTDAVIAASSGGFPYSIDVHHIGGVNRLVPGLGNTIQVRTQTGEDQIGLTGQITTSNFPLRKNDIVFFSKENADSNWQFNQRIEDASANISKGALNVRSDFAISDTSTVETDLTALTPAIQKGDGFIITDTTPSSLLGVGTPSTNDIVFANKDNPNLTITSSDWFLIRLTTTGLSTRDRILLSSFDNPSGVLYQGRENILVNANNIQKLDFTATGTPYTGNYLDSTPEDGSASTSRTRVFNDSTIQFARLNLQGSKLTLRISFSSNSFSGFVPQLNNIVISFSTFNFTFPLTGIDPTGNQEIDIPINIPADDYKAAQGVNAVVTLNYTYTGASWNGSFTILSLTNQFIGPLHDPAQEIAIDEVAKLRSTLELEIGNLREALTGSRTQLPQRLDDRLSPLTSVTTETVDLEDSLFSDNPSGTGGVPNIGTFTRVSPDHNFFTVTGVGVFIAAPADNEHLFINITQNEEKILTPANAQADAELTLVQSVTFQDQTLFVYRVTGLTANDNVRVVLSRTTQVALWGLQLDNLRSQVNTILDLIRNNPVFNLPTAVQSWLANDLTIQQQDNITYTPTPFNQSFGTGFDGFLREPNESVLLVNAAGEQVSERIRATGGATRGRKVAYIPLPFIVDGDPIVEAIDGIGVVQEVLVQRNGTDINARRFVPAVAAGSQTVTRYPAPATGVAYEGFWQDIPTATRDAAGRLVPEADELFFSRDLPRTSTTLTIQYRGIANGNVIGANTTTLAGVGGGSDVRTTVTVSTGSETATIEILWRHAQRDVRVSVTEVVSSGLPVISSVQVILSWTETVAIPAQPATTELVKIGDYDASDTFVIMFSPSLPTRINNDASTLIIITKDIELDTGYTFNELFRFDDSGRLKLTVTNSLQGERIPLYDVTFVPHTPAAVRLNTLKLYPRQGLFNENHNNQSVAVIDTQFIAVDEDNNSVNLAQEQILESPDGTKYRLQIPNGGGAVTAVAVT